MSIARGRAVDDALSARDARDLFLRESGLDTSGYEAPDFVVRVGPVTLRFPNPGLLPYHDLHHVITGYGGDFLGEAEISAFELRAGGTTPLIRLLSVGALAMAVFVAPLRVLRAWRRARGARSLYVLRQPYERLLDMKVGELRALCGVDSRLSCAKQGQRTAAHASNPSDASGDMFWRAG